MRLLLDPSEEEAEQNNTTARKPTEREIRRVEFFFLFLTSIKYYMFNGKVDRLLAQFCYYIPRILRSLNPEKNRNHTHTQTETHVKYTILLTRNMLCYMKSLVGKIREFCRILKNHQFLYKYAVDIIFLSNHNTFVFGLQTL